MSTEQGVEAPTAGAPVPTPGPPAAELTGLIEPTGLRSQTGTAEAAGLPEQVGQPGPMEPAGQVAEIATLITPPTTPDTDELDPATGEPVRPIAVGVAAALSWLSVAASAASLIRTYWVAVYDFAGASWLFGQFPTGPGDLLRVGLAAGLTAAVLLAMIASTIVGFYAWTGYRWSRVAGLIAAGLSLLMLLGGRLGWAAIPLVFVGAGLLWLPSAKRYFEAWWRLRHPSVTYAPPTRNVAYGPLERYR